MRGTHGSAQIGFAAFAKQALAALGGVQGDDVIARLHAGNALAHLHDDARAFVPQHGGKDAFGIIAAQGEGVGVAHAGVGDAQQHFARAGRGHVDFNNLQGFAGFKGNGGA